MATFANIAPTPQVGGMPGNYGSVPFSLIGQTTINGTVVNNGPAQLFGLIVSNISAGIYYLKLYDQTTIPDPTADPTPVPVQRIMLPANSTGAGIAAGMIEGMNFLKGIAFTITVNFADNDNTAVNTLGDVLVNLRTRGVV